MRTIKGPGIFLAQYIGAHRPFDSLDGLLGWAKGLGFAGVQVPIHDSRILDVRRAASDDDHLAAIKALLARHEMEISELAAHRAGHCLAVHPAYDAILDGFAAPEARGDPAAREAWAREQLELAIAAASRLGLRRVATFSGALLWPYAYPYPPPPAGLIEAGFAALAARWRPLLDRADAAGIDLCFELHPGEDLHDGASFELFLERVDHHPRARILFDPSHMLLQHMDYLGFIERYHARIGAFHVKDAEFNPSPRAGVYGGYQGWLTRPGRFRSVGDGQVDFAGIFARLAALDYDGWAVLEWECCLKRPEDGAREGARFIRERIIQVAERPFDVPLRRAVDAKTIDRMLGIER